MFNPIQLVPDVLAVWGNFFPCIYGNFLLLLYIETTDTPTMVKKFEIRNSTAEFLTFIATGKEDGIQVLYKDETVWATQKAISELFDCSTDNIGLH